MPSTLLKRNTSNTKSDSGTQPAQTIIILKAETKVRFDYLRAGRGPRLTWWLELRPPRSDYRLATCSRKNDRVNKLSDADSRWLTRHADAIQRFVFQRLILLRRRRRLRLLRLDTGCSDFAVMVWRWPCKVDVLGFCYQTHLVNDAKGFEMVLEEARTHYEITNERL